MSWIYCPECGVKRTVETVSVPEGWQNFQCWNCGDPGWIQPYDSDDPLSGRNRKPIMTLTDEQLRMVIKVNFDPVMKSLVEVFQRMTESLKRMYPWMRLVSQAHRAEVKRVHTMYRRKKGKRW